jgi:hypothetical protein
VVQLMVAAAQQSSTTTTLSSVRLRKVEDTH